MGILKHNSIAYSPLFIISDQHELLLYIQLVSYGGMQNSNFLGIMN